MEANTVAMQAAREFLEQVRRLRNEIEDKERRIEMLRDMATSTTGRMSDMPRSDSPDLQKMESVLCKVTDLEREVAGKRIALAAAKERVTTALCELEDYKEQRVLFARYIECRAWSSIAEETGYGRSSMYRYHDAGVAHIAKALDRGVAHA